MGKLLIEVKLDIEPMTWGGNDAKRRKELREAIRKEIPEFDEQYMECLLRECEEVSVILNCYLVDPTSKDIDNLAKLPIDAVFFSGQNEKGYRGWESRITSLTVKKLRSSENALELTIYETSSQ